MKNTTSIKVKRKLQQGVVFKMVLILLLNCAWPSVSLALTGGPSQPEVQSFEPVGVSDMVDAFSGDFSYNIPLFDIDGYPMNISYHSGIGMDQEASWTGLGWNVNPGVINRSMRGLPDDFNGDMVTKEQNVKKNQTIGLSCGFAAELFGYDGAQLSARLGIKYNNYTGVGVEKSFNVALSESNKYGQGGSISLGITSSSDDGLSLAPAVSLSQQTSKTDKNNKLGISIGAAFNSRGGLTAMTIAPEVSQSMGQKNGGLKKFLGGALSSAGARFNLGQQTYSPNLDFPMENLSVTANFKLGLELWGVAGSIAPGAYYSEQGQLVKSIKCPAYGYMNAQNGQNNSAAMMDFNREKDGSFNKSTYNLPITNLTYDLYSVSAQGSGGSYRPFRSDVGHVFDTESYSTSDGFSGSLEIGAGAIFKGGIDISTNSAYSHSGDWSSSKAAENMAFQGTGPNPDYEPWYFKEANERSVNSDPGFLGRYGGFSANRFELDGDVKFDAKTTGKIINTEGTTQEISTDGKRLKRDKRNQSILSLTNMEVYAGLGLFGGAAGSGIKNPYILSNINKLGHHIGQITSMNTDGRRYVYTLPVYNKEQQEVTFAVGKPVGGGSARTAGNGLVSYVPGQDNSINNKMGLDNYYSNTKMPPFAHSYMLSAVLSSDYVDVTGNGPSDDDLGNYVLFDYVLKEGDYNWRTPVEAKKAKHNAGLLADVNDDKGSYVYGVKQLYYLDKITTKNYEARFNLSGRNDGKGVAGKDGGPGTAMQYKLDNIVLSLKATSKVIKTVHFDYDYSLCDVSAQNGSAGKLTLKKLYFTYQNSGKGAYNSYDFAYFDNPAAPRPSNDVENPSYSSTQYDRWGNYKRTDPAVPQLSNEFFPYTNQYLSAQAMHEDAAVWSLKEIKLPSGGKIKIEYESDDYAYVQDKKATQMYLFNNSASAAMPASPTPLLSNFVFVFDIPQGSTATKISDFLPDNRMVFFKFKMLLDPALQLYDYVPGYAEADLTSVDQITNVPRSRISGGKGYIAFVETNTNDDNPSLGTNVSPIVKAALQFGRLNTPRIMWNQPNASASVSHQVVKALINSSFMSNVSQAALGPNTYLYQTKAKNADLSASWIKLKNVTGKKYGGGSRVKRILLNDDFNNMTGEESSTYGQMYTYTTKDRDGKMISSGVASYEPQVGGEENALKEPFFTETKKLLVPDDEHYTEAPFGESFYPSASVGYSKVKIENYYPSAGELPAPWTGSGFNSKKTGYTVSEFYTARDFPTITERTELEAIEHKNDPFDLASIFSINTKNHMTASQGFYVEVNDMHGKPKSVKTYNVREQEISSVEYFYKSQPYGGSGGKRLINTVQMVNPNGGVTSGEVGVFFDAVGDLREQTTETETDGININTDIIEAVIPLVTVVPIPSFASDKTQFRSAVITKVVQRFGILEKTIARQDGSTITSSDLAYDSETGEVLLTQTMNGYNDQLYSFKYPAYWYYDNMGPAYKNAGYTQTITFSAAGKATLPLGTNMFAEGDEVIIQNTGTGNYSKGWITKSLKNNIEISDIAGAAAPAAGTYLVKVTRSGRRNMQTMDMAEITTMVNPLGGVRSNVYQRVISSKAIEYDNYWSINCDCYAQGALATANPYVTGLAGNWRVKNSYTYLTPRSQTNANNNSNLRTDGFYTNYTPFYKNAGNKWKINPQGWTSLAEVTNFSPEGQELENRDALGRYSSATYGFNQSLVMSVAANSKNKEQGYTGFENDYTTGCTPDKHFAWGPFSNSGYALSNLQAHTGKTSLSLSYIVYANNPAGGITSEYGFIKPITTDCTMPAKCPGTIAYSDGSYKLTGAAPPFILDVDKQNGDGTITLNNDGNDFTVNANGTTFKCVVTLIDQKGCIYTKLVKYPFNN